MVHTSSGLHGLPSKDNTMMVPSGAYETADLVEYPANLHPAKCTRHKPQNSRPFLFWENEEIGRTINVHVVSEGQRKNQKTIRIWKIILAVRCSWMVTKNGCSWKSKPSNLVTHLCHWPADDQLNIRQAEVQDEGKTIAYEPLAKQSWAWQTVEIWDTTRQAHDHMCNEAWRCI